MDYLISKLFGLPDTTVKESKERVKTAIKNSGVELLSKRIIVNLAPANTRKAGSQFDLSIAIGILIASGEVGNKYLYKFLEETIFIGELSLNGKVEKVNGILPICIEAKKLGIKRIVLPKENAKESAVLEGLEILPIQSLKEIVEYLNGEGDIEKEKIREFDIQKQSYYGYDFADVKGQEIVKRALEVSAAGGHNCLLIRKSRFWKDYVSKKISHYITRYYF